MITIPFLSQAPP